MIATDRTVREYVIEDFRTAAVFERHRIDFCCGGARPLAEACRARGVDVQTVVNDLETVLAAPAAGEPAFGRWELDFLAEYIVNNHHSYVREALPVIQQHAEKVARVHGERHPEVVRIAEIFSDVAGELGGHMHKEEAILFPAIRALVQARKNGTEPPQFPFGSLRHPITMMEREHSSAGGGLEEISSLTNNYQPPGDACTTFRVLYQELQGFEMDLHRHVHLENNILFPKAIGLEGAGS